MASSVNWTNYIITMKLLSTFRISLDSKHDARNQDAHLEHITRSLFSIIGICLLISTSIGLFIHFSRHIHVTWHRPLFVGAIIIYAIAWVFMHNGQWRWARYFLLLLFLSSGALLNTVPDLISIAILQYVLGITLTSILFDSKFQWVVVALTSIFYLLITALTKVQFENIFLSSHLVIPIIFVAFATFQQISSNMVNSTINNLIEETAVRKRAQDSAEQKEKILAAIAQSAQLLIETSNWKNKTNEVLALVGKASNASHAYLFQNDLDENKIPVTSQKYEWVAEGQVAEINNRDYQNVPLYEEPMREWYELMKKGQYFYQDTKQLPPDWANTPSRKQIKTLLDVPIFVNDQWWGVVGFDDMLREAPWSQAEIDTMRIVASILGSVITRQNADEELRASEDKFQTTFHESLVPMVIGRLSDRLILDANFAFAELTGFSRRETVDHFPSDLGIWANQAERTKHRELLNKQGYLREFKAHLKKKSGEIAVVLISVSVIKVNSEDCFLYTIYEITQLEHALNDLQDKNNELERFTYTVSHDLKAPLITIGGFAGLLEKDIKSGNEEVMLRSIRRILDAVTKMERLLNELLELSRVGRIIHEPQEVSFGEIAKEAVSLAQGRLSAPNLKVQIEADLPTVKVDKVRIAEVLQNLLENSAKFMGEQANPTIQIGAINENQNWVFFVKDNGIGVEKAYHERIFGLFNKLDPKTDGTGIGLALVKRIIEFHGGTIWIESELGKGSTFYFTLGH